MRMLILPTLASSAGFIVTPLSLKPKVDRLMTVTVVYDARVSEEGVVHHCLCERCGGQPRIGPFLV